MDVILGGILVAAVYDDVRRFKISNRIILAGWIVSAIYNIFRNGLQSILSWILVSAFPIILLSALFVLRVVGAGDIKLLSVISGMIGVRMILQIILLSFIYGAILAFVKMIYYRNVFSRINYFVNYCRRTIRERKVNAYIDDEVVNDRASIHFSIAIALAVMTMYIMKMF